MPVPNPHPGRLIVFEGIDGSGKSTQAKILADTLREGMQVIQTAEPTRGVFGRMLREKFARGERFEHEEEAKLFAADREHHTDDLLLPALEAGAIVIQDRTWLSSLAYQSSTHGSGKDILALNADALIPDVCIWMDMLVRTAQLRIAYRGVRDPFEDYPTLDFARDTYAYWESKSDWMYRVEANNMKQYIADDIMEVLLNIPGFFQ